MARKKKHEEHENHERWLVSYADFITLLFAFFVVMYALSSVNEGKYRVLSDALIAAFRNAPQSMLPIQIGEPIKAPEKVMTETKIELQPSQDLRGEGDLRGRASDEGKGEGAGKERERMKKIASQLEKAFGGMIEKKLISVVRTGRGLEIEINSSILFESGSALLQIEAIPILTQIAAIIKDYPNAIRVEGFTDNLPINTPVYPSNWELSSGRAASVVHLFSDEGVDPYRLAAIGFGEHRPVADNNTEAGRQRNRRVLVVLMSESAEKQYDRSKIATFEPETVRRQDIDMDAPVPVIEMPLMSPTQIGVPDTMPGELPLRGRGQDKMSSQERGQLIDVTDELETLGNGQQGDEAP